MSKHAGLLFFPGLDHEQDARHFPRCMISVNRLRNRKSDFKVRDWMLDSGAFTELRSTALSAPQWKNTGLR